MMNKLLILIFLITLISTVNGAELSTITLKQWNKEELSEDHLRFSHPEKKGIVLHLQIDSYDKNNFWKKETLKEDIEKMAAIRKTMSFFLGISDYAITSYKLETTTQRPQLSITGSYSRLDNQLIQFSETNFYGNENFLQLKIISEDQLPSDKEIKELIKEINPNILDID
ncbi:MAG: hypothetical protein EHM20_06325, partial [Alphaproteobacteria bacterium]